MQTMRRAERNIRLVVCLSGTCELFINYNTYTILGKVIQSCIDRSIGREMCQVGREGRQLATWLVGTYINGRCMDTYIHKVHLRTYRQVGTQVGQVTYIPTQRMKNDKNRFHLARYLPTSLINQTDIIQVHTYTKIERVSVCPQQLYIFYTSKSRDYINIHNLTNLIINLILTYA